MFWVKEFSALVIFPTILFVFFLWKVGKEGTNYINRIRFQGIPSTSTSATRLVSKSSNVSDTSIRVRVFSDIHIPLSSLQKHTSNNNSPHRVHGTSEYRDRIRYLIQAIQDCIADKDIGVVIFNGDIFDTWNLPYDITPPNSSPAITKNENEENNYPLEVTLFCQAVSMLQQVNIKVVFIIGSHDDTITPKFMKSMFGDRIMVYREYFDFCNTRFTHGHHWDVLASPNPIYQYKQVHRLDKQQDKNNANKYNSPKLIPINDLALRPLGYFLCRICPFILDSEDYFTVPGTSVPIKTIVSKYISKLKQSETDKKEQYRLIEQLTAEYIDAAICETKKKANLDSLDSDDIRIVMDDNQSVNLNWIEQVLNIVYSEWFKYIFIDQREDFEQLYSLFDYPSHGDLSFRLKNPHRHFGELPPQLTVQGHTHIPQIQTFFYDSSDLVVDSRPQEIKKMNEEEYFEFIRLMHEDFLYKEEDEKKLDDDNNNNDNETENHNINNNPDNNNQYKNSNMNINNNDNNKSKQTPQHHILGFLHFETNLEKNENNQVQENEERIYQKQKQLKQIDKEKQRFYNWQKREATPNQMLKTNMGSNLSSKERLYYVNGGSWGLARQYRGIDYGMTFVDIRADDVGPLSITIYRVDDDDDDDDEDIDNNNNNNSRSQINVLSLEELEKYGNGFRKEKVDSVTLLDKRITKQID